MCSSPIILYIDTSSSYLYSGLVKENELLAKISLKLDKNLSSFSLSKIDEMFKNANLKINDINKIIVVNGPGSFTGVRIGITIAKTIAWGLNKEITTITSLEAMSVSTDVNKYKIPIIDARRGNVFAGIYDKDNNKVLTERFISINTLKVAVDNLNSEYAYITNDDIEIDNKVNYEPNILAIFNKYKDKSTINPHAVNPEYFKTTEAEETKGIKFDD